MSNPRSSISPFRSAVAGYARAQADWRDAKALEYPDDARNERSAEALRRFADYIDRLDEASLELATLWSLHNGLTEFFSPNTEMGRVTFSRLGFTSEVADDDFPRVFAEFVAEERADPNLWRTTEGS